MKKTFTVDGFNDPIYDIRILNKALDAVKGDTPTRPFGKRNCALTTFTGDDRMAMTWRTKTGWHSEFIPREAYDDTK